jgi:hypothetical protein
LTFPLVLILAKNIFINLMAKIEQIEFDNYPIWDKQSDESEDNFLRFNQWFLPQIKPNLLAAYRAYCQANGDGKRQNKLTLKDAPQSWRVACERDRWRERHRAYWRKLSQDNLQWQAEKLRELQEVELLLASRLLERANDILNLPTNPQNDRLKDATALVRTASDISRKALGQDNLNSAIALLTRNGFEVIDPTLMVESEGATSD